MADPYNGPPGPFRPDLGVQATGGFTATRYDWRAVRREGDAPSEPRARVDVVWLKRLGRSLALPAGANPKIKQSCRVRQKSL